MPEWRLIPRRLLQISPTETKLERRGFSVTTPEIQERLEDAGAAFLEGYHAALDESQPQVLTSRLAAISPDRRGFAFEGAGMSLLLQDRLTLFGRRHRFATFATEYGDGHVYMLHVGAGWALARLPWAKRRLDRAIVVFDALLRWLVVDGFGFHEGFFHSNQSILRCRVPAGLGAYARRAFDQGLGRSLWFFNGADPDRIVDTIGAFAEGRRADLWSGVGLACAYAGGLEAVGVRRLVDAAGPFLPEFAQGVAFAAKARQRGGNPVPDTERVCRIACGLSAADAADVTDLALRSLPHDGDQPTYEIWRRRIRTELVSLRCRRHEDSPLEMLR